MKFPELTLLCLQHYSGVKKLYCICFCFIISEVIPGVKSSILTLYTETLNWIDRITWKNMTNYEKWCPSDTELWTGRQWTYSNLYYLFSLNLSNLIHISVPVLSSSASWISHLRVYFLGCLTVSLNLYVAFLMLEPWSDFGLLDITVM